MTGFNSASLKLRHASTKLMHDRSQRDAMLRYAPLCSALLVSRCVACLHTRKSGRRMMADGAAKLLQQPLENLSPARIVDLRNCRGTRGTEKRRRIIRNETDAARREPYRVLNHWWERQRETWFGVGTRWREAGRG
ncbi:hypothetical protein BDW67DRAFT_163431 [Aspergillus spinulosporus]